MRIEGLVGRTLRARPSGVSAAMAQAMRAGLVRPSRGGWIALPLGVRVLDRLSELAVEGLGCQPVAVVGPGRDDIARGISELLKGETQSYRQLPLRIATIGTGNVSDSHPEAPTDATGSLFIAGVFAAEDGMSGFVAGTQANMIRLAKSAGIRLSAARGFGGATALMAHTASGHDLALTCAACNESHLSEAAPFAREEAQQGARQPMERVHTPGASTIQALAELLAIDRKQTLKALFLADEEGTLVFAVLRGDLEASMGKLAQVTGSEHLRAATDVEIIAGGAYPGFASPVGLQVRKSGQRDGVNVIADLSAFTGGDFVVGANVEDYHLAHVDPRRDFAISEVADIALPPAEAHCHRCGAALAETRGTIVALTSPFDPPTFSDESGTERKASAAGTRVDLFALFEALVEACADDRGIAWPAVVAPADVHVISIKEDAAGLSAVQAMESDGLSVLYDDRPIGAGAKFTDADLIGCPLRATASSRSLAAGGFELADRKGTSPEVVGLSELAGRVKARLAALMSS